MAILTQQALKDYLNTAGIQTNGIQGINGAEMRTILTDIIDSMHAPKNANGYSATFNPTALTGNVVLELPTTSGTLALTSDLSNYISSASNGLTKTGSAIKLGGLLTEDTSIRSTADGAQSIFLGISPDYSDLNTNRLGVFEVFSASDIILGVGALSLVPHGGTYTNYYATDTWADVASNSPTELASVRADRTQGVMIRTNRSSVDTWAILRNNLLTQNRTYNFPDASGTLALTSNLSAYLLLTGGTISGVLTVNSFFLNNPGGGYTFNSTSDGLLATSPSFTTSTNDITGGLTVRDRIIPTNQKRTTMTPDSFVFGTPTLTVGTALKATNYGPMIDVFLPSSTGTLSLTSEFGYLPTDTVAGALALPVGGQKRLVFVSDEVGGPTVAYNDGTNWRRVYDNAIIS